MSQLNQVGPSHGLAVLEVEARTRKFSTRVYRSSGVSEDILAS